MHKRGGKAYGREGHQGRRTEELGAVDRTENVPEDSQMQFHFVCP